MVEHSLDRTFSALADPTRRAILARLREGERSVGDLAAPLDMTLAGAAKHLVVLERAGLIERRRAGRHQLCRLRADRFAEADAWLRDWQLFWTTRLDRLAAVLGDDANEMGEK